MPQNKQGSGMDADEFKFPDEAEQNSSNKAEASADSFEIEIEDDTPEEDRGRAPMPKELVQELEKDELESYDEGVKNKLKQMRKVWHDERREKEAALREQQEALTFAKKLLDENKRIKEILSTGEREYVNVTQNAATLEIEAAKRAYKEAYEAGDADKLVDAQQALQAANLKLMQAKSFKLPPLQEEEFPVQPVQQQVVPQVPTPDTRALSWQQRNPWFGQDEEMTAAALGLHQKLVRSGVEAGSDEYYASLDKTIRKRFPEIFEEPEEKSRSDARSRPSTVVAPAVRSTSSNKIKLRASQVQLAKKLGLTPEQYAKEQIKLEAQNG
jgi:hypothetical protein